MPIVDMPVDPNKPTYCLCQQVSYGEMIGCDNLDCPVVPLRLHGPRLQAQGYCPKCTTMFKKDK